ncbi:IS110 family transposase [Kitasatospora purpeofusca]|uniref:IS110 family transposase n=1 Tax=Kitasatospora purpeofusca TaxID=67352 RepID=UPI0039A639ED
MVHRSPVAGGCGGGAGHGRNEAVPRTGAGRPVYAINPVAAARYRERRTVARKKSDHLDALVLANILRTDADAHRQLPTDSELVQAVAVLARAQQNAVRDRTQAGNKVTSHLREYFPGFLAAVGHRREGIFHPITRVLLTAAPTPQQASELTRAQLRALLKKAGRKNTIDAEAERLHTALRSPQRCRQGSSRAGLRASAASSGRPRFGSWRRQEVGPGSGRWIASGFPTVRTMS